MLLRAKSQRSAAISITFPELMHLVAVLFSLSFSPRRRKLYMLMLDLAGPPATPHPCDCRLKTTSGCFPPLDSAHFAYNFICSCGVIRDRNSTS